MAAVAPVVSAKSKQTVAKEFNNLKLDSSGGALASNKAMQMIKYKLIFQTKNFHYGESYDNKVFVQMFGKQGTSSLVHVACPAHDPNKIFDKSNKQDFEIEAEDVGEIMKLRVLHDNKLGSFKWHLQWVLVECNGCGGGQRVKFDCNEWLEADITSENGQMLKVDILSQRAKDEADGFSQWEAAAGESADGSYTKARRNIEAMKAKEVEGSEAHKVLCRADEVLKSDDFCAKKEKSRAYLQKHNLLDEWFEERMEELAIDMAAREAERAGDMMEQERAGLSPADMAKVPKMDETNNPCYKYLREHGNMWQYDPAKVDPRMKGRLYRRFDTFDKDSDGTMTIDEVLTWAERMKSVCETDEYEVEKVREALECYFTMYGLGGEGCARENWVESHTAMGAAVEERRRQGDPIPMEFLANAYFDVIDEDDDGLLNMTELKKMMNVFRVPEEAAYTFFEKADVDESGYLERVEMHQLFYSFWFDACFNYDDSLDNIFAYKY